MLGKLKNSRPIQINFKFQRGAKYRPLAGLACAADLLTASDTEIEVDDVDVTMSGVPSDIIFVSSLIMLGKF